MVPRPGSLRRPGCGLTPAAAGTTDRRTGGEATPAGRPLSITPDDGATSRPRRRRRRLPVPAERFLTRDYGPSKSSARCVTPVLTASTAHARTPRYTRPSLTAALTAASAASAAAVAAFPVTDPGVHAVRRSLYPHFVIFYALPPPTVGALSDAAIRLSVRLSVCPSRFSGYGY